MKEMESPPLSSLQIDELVAKPLAHKTLGSFLGQVELAIPVKKAAFKRLEVEATPPIVYPHPLDVSFSPANVWETSGGRQATPMVEPEAGIVTGVESLRRA